jgi:hypothetical protein
VLPDQLPTALRQELQQALCCSPTILLGAVRSGCTHLTASLLLSGAEAAALQQPAGAAEALARLLQAWRQEQAGWRLPAELPLLRVVAQAETSSGALLLQPLMPQLQATPGGGPAASRLGAAGGTVRVVSMADAEDAQLQRRRLQLTAVGPSATTVSTAGGRFQLHCQDWQQLLLGESSSGSSPGSRVLHCRRGGHHVAVALLHPGSPSEEREEEAAEQADPCSVADAAAEAAAASEEEEEEEEQRLLQLLAEHPGAEVWLPEAERRWGLYEFELASGGRVWACLPGCLPGIPWQAGCFDDDDGRATAGQLICSCTATAISQALVAVCCQPQSVAPAAPTAAAGPLLGSAAPVLVLPDELAAVADELQQLQAATAAAAAAGTQPALPPAFNTAVLQLVNVVLQFLEGQQEVAAAVAEGADSAAAALAAHAAAYPPAALERLAAAARWLCALCVRCRWPALLRALLPGTTASGDAAAAVAGMDASLPAGLLGMAAATGSPQLLLALGGWAAAAGHRWQLGARGSGSGRSDLTPLHLAAALGPSLSQAAAAALVAAAGQAAATECWLNACSGG